MWVVDEANFIRSGAVCWVHNSLVASVGRGSAEERHTNERAINEVVARSLTINQVDKATVAECSAEWLDKLINL